MTGKFRDFIELNEEELDAMALATQLSRTLGSKLRTLGFSKGSRNSGIVAMADKNSDTLNDTIAAVNKWLKNVDGGELKIGGVTKDMLVKYRGNILSVVDTGKTIKVIVS